MPTITIRDPTLVERLRRLKPVPVDDYYDDVIYELLRRAEGRGEGKTSLRGLDNLPQLIAEEVRKALDGQLVETLKAALLPAVGNLDVEIPVNLSIKVRVRLEPVFDVSPVSPASNSSSSNNDAVAKPTNNVENKDRTAEIDELERRAIELLRERGGCWEGSAYSLARHVAGRVDYALETRLRRKLVRRDGKICLPDVTQ